MHFNNINTNEYKAIHLVIKNLTLVPYAIPCLIRTKNEKLLAKMRNNPQDWRIDDLKHIADRLGINYRQPGTSHVTFRIDNGEKLTVPAHKPVKPIYVKQFLVFIEDGGFNSE